MKKAEQSVLSKQSKNKLVGGRLKKKDDDKSSQHSKLTGKKKIGGGDGPRFLTKKEKEAKEMMDKR
jgi:hypothetical protein